MIDIKDAHRDPAAIKGKKIAICGGGLSGSDFALEMATEYGKQCTIIEMKPDVAMDMAEADVRAALAADRLSPEGFGALLSPAAEPLRGGAGRRRPPRAAALVRQHGVPVHAAVPGELLRQPLRVLRLQPRQRLCRARLDRAGIVAELDAIAATGLEEILLLTGEDRARTDPFYIGEACKLAAERFRMVGVEVYPMNEDEYAYLHECGVDYVTVFQETYDPALYGKLHLAGRKRVFPYRANAQERAMRGGMRGAAFGALLGLGDFRRDAFACGLHAWLVQRAYPHAELSLSCPACAPSPGTGRWGRAAWASASCCR